MKKWLVSIIVLTCVLGLSAQTPEKLYILTPTWPPAAELPSIESIAIRRVETSNGQKRVVYWVYDSTLPQPLDKVETVKDENGVESEKRTPVPRPYANGSVTVSAKLTDEQVENEVVKDAEQVFAAWLAHRGTVAPTVTTNATPASYNAAKIKIIRARLAASKPVVIVPEP